MRVIVNLLQKRLGTFIWNSNRVEVYTGDYAIKRFFHGKQMVTHQIIVPFQPSTRSAGSVRVQPYKYNKNVIEKY